MWMTQAASKQNLVENEPVMAGHDQKAMAWGSFGTRRPACPQTSWTKPKEESSEEAEFCCCIFPCSPSLYTDAIPLLWVCLSLGSSFHEGSSSALGTFQVQLSTCKDAQIGWPEWNLHSLKTGAAHWKNQTAQFAMQRPTLYSFVPFVVDSSLLPFLAAMTLALENIL